MVNVIYIPPIDVCAKRKIGCSADLTIAVAGLAGYRTKQGADAFQTWLANHALLPYTATDDPLHIGVPLGVQYALGLEPGAPDRSRLPFATDPGTATALSFIRPLPSPLAVRYSVEVSSELDEWHSGDLWTWPETTLDNGDGTETVSVRLRPPGDVADRLFLRLRIIIPSVD